MHFRRFAVWATGLALTTAGCSSAASQTTPSTPSTRVSTSVPAAATVPKPTTPPTTNPRVHLTTAATPTVAAPPGAQWIRVASTGRSQVAAVYRPRAKRTAPVVVLLHGSSGLIASELALARRLADGGFVVLAGCYLDVHPGSVTPNPSVLPCPGLPNELNATTDDMDAAVRALYDAATSLRGVEPEHLGVVGMSQGAITSLGLDDPRVRAIVADSGYRKAPGTPTVPVLLLGRIDDSHVPNEKLRAFEAAERVAHRPITARYWEGTGHVAILKPGPIGDEAVTRTLAFLRRYAA